MQSNVILEKHFYNILQNTEVQTSKHVDIIKPEQFALPYNKPVIW